MRRPTRHVVFSPKKNSGGPASPNINTFLRILAHVKIIAFSTKVCPGFSKKILVLILLCVSVFSKIRYDQRSKNPKIRVNTGYFRNPGHTFPLY